MLPTRYIPKSPADFIGDAKTVSLQLGRVATDAKAHANAPIKVLFNGEPGIGKSAVSRYLITLLGANPSDKWSYKKYNGTQIKLETVEEIARDLHYCDIYGAYRIIWIEEADMIPAVAQVRFLTLLDDLPDGAAVICTSNCKVDEFKKRFQTRFKIYEMAPPLEHEVQGLLRKFLTDERTITHIAFGAAGNVRAALIDAESALQAAA
ncbi:MAG TPA: ATP-binding protein [Verrucomicrobiae bacterium]|jgi:DNA polymerase III delta prime subunit|nr:ATP-binding protein [Verrucomicrobiae bacterium]